MSRDRDSLRPVEEASDDEERCTDHRRWADRARAPKRSGCVANDDASDDEVKQADEEVRDAEEHGVVSEGHPAPLSDAEHAPIAASIASRMPPSSTSMALVNHVYAAHAHRRRREDERPAKDAIPRQVVREHDRDLVIAKSQVRSKKKPEERSDLMLRVGFRVAVSLGRAT